MTRTVINIDVLEVFNLSIGKVYSIKFPHSVLPFSGLKFIFNECTWKVKGIAVSGRMQDENIWDCIIIPVTDCSTDLPKGSYTIEAIDLKQRFMN